MEKVILTQPIYAGYNSYNDVQYFGTHIPIIEQNTFDAVQALFQKRLV